MDILQKIVDLRKERNWTEATLAEKSGLTQSTISTWYRRKITPSIPSLTKICDAFEITLSQFFLESNDQVIHLTTRQLRLLATASRLNKDQYDALIRFLSLLNQKA